MPELRSIVKKVGTTAVIYGQILFVFLAFTVMVISSYQYVQKMMLSRLEDKVNTSLDFMQAGIESDLTEPNKLLQSMSQSIRNMILNGYDSGMIQSYIKEITPNVIKYEERKLGINRMYGYFDVFNGLELNNGEWAQSMYDNPWEYPWYKAAVEAKGKVTFAAPYFNARIRSYILTYSRQIYEDDKALATIALDVMIDSIIDYVTGMQIVEDGYGLLTDENLVIIAHPDLYLIGKELRNVNSSLAGHLASYLGADGNYIPKSTAVNYKGLECVVYSRKLKTGWYLSLVAPVNEYYREIRNMGLVLSCLGLIMAAGLSVILWRINVSRKKLDEENRQKSDFLAKMSHEIRTPMSNILGITEIYLQDRTIREDIREALSRIYSSGDLLLGIINDILDFSKIEAGKMELVPVKYYTPSMINDVVQLNKIQNENKPIEFKLKVDELIPAELIGDELRIKQILNNLLSNAFKYTDKGEVSLSVSLEQTRGTSADLTVVFKVCDTGQGMTPEQVNKLFDKYSRFNLEANRATQGTGLGMNITLNLVNMMGGMISVKSAPGKGTEVTVKLPQGVEGSSAAIGREMAETLRQFKLSGAPHAEKAEITCDPMPYGSVLIVDDVETNLYVAKGLMAFYELAIDTAVSGFEAIDKIRSGNSYDVIFMDHMMPRMDGIEAAKILREMGYKGTIIALTANAIVGQAEMFMSNGFDGFISKPIDLRRLNSVLSDFIRDKKPPEVVEAARLQKELKKKEGAAEKKIKQSELEKYFTIDAGNALKELERIRAKTNALDEGDIESYKIAVHSMKSVLANLGETGLSETAGALERAAKGKNLAMMSRETPAFMDALKSLIKKYDSAKGSEDAQITGEDAAYLREKLLEFKTACKAVNKKAAKTALNDLKQKEWPLGINDVLDTLSAQLLHGDFEKAASAAESAANRQ